MPRIAAQKATIEQAGRQVTQAQAALKLSNQDRNRPLPGPRPDQAPGTVQRAQQAVLRSARRNRRASAAAQRRHRAAARSVRSRCCARKRRRRRDAQLAPGAGAEGGGRRPTSPGRSERRATQEGRVTRLTGAVGQRTPRPGPGAAGAGASCDLWVTANFKETQLARHDGRASRSTSRSTPMVGKTYPGPCRQRAGRERHGLQPDCRRKTPPAITSRWCSGCR